MTIPFKKLLTGQTGLLTLSQSDCDLFMIAQANSITYNQLSITGLHGSTKTSGRISLKNLEKKGFIVSRELPGTGKEKYYLLTPKGKQHFKQVFGTRLPEEYAIDLERRMPTGSSQIPHRILTGDLYFSFLANPFLAEIPVWQIESPYQDCGKNTIGPRCDAALKTSHMTYYIEQDNSTQGRNALSVKLLQYMKAPCFLGDGMKHNHLIFTINCEIKERHIQLQPYSVYRILLKARQIWKCLEQASGTNITFKEFGANMENKDSFPAVLLTRSEKEILERICALYPDYGYDGLEQLAKNYLHDSSREEERRSEQDSLFNRRLHQAFYPFLDDPDHSTLQHRLRTGLSVTAVPNHRLRDILPFLLQAEYNFPKFLHHILYSLGISELELWTYRETCPVRERENRMFLFRNVFTCEECDCIIAAEDISHDLGSRARLQYFFTENNLAIPVLFLCFVSCRADAEYFLEENHKHLSRYQNSRLSLCFLNETEHLFFNPDSQEAYFKQNDSWHPAQISFDRFSGSLALTERQV